MVQKIDSIKRRCSTEKGKKKLMHGNLIMNSSSHSIRLRRWCSTLAFARFDPKDEKEQAKRDEIARTHTHKSNKIVTVFRAGKTLSNKITSSSFSLWNRCAHNTLPSGSVLAACEGRAHNTLNVCTIITDDNCYDVFNLCALHTQTGVPFHMPGV